MASQKLDHTEFTVVGDKSVRPKKLIPNGVRWWLADDKHLPAAVMQHVGQIIQSDRGRIDGYNTFAKLYGTFTPALWNGYQLSNSGRPTAPVRDRLTYNIVQSAIDTVTARVTQNKPKPWFLTNAGDSKVQRKAKKLDQFCYGTFYENNVYGLGGKSFRDGGVFGEGIVYCYENNGRIGYERVLPYELLTDYLESHAGPETTMSLFRPRNIDRTVLAEMYPDKAEYIAKMANTSSFISAASRSVSDTVTIVEAWRLPANQNTPGRHVVVTGDEILDQEDWNVDFFPFAVMRYCPRLYGFYGQGLAEQLVPVQTEINRTLISIQRSLYLGGTHKIFVKSGSKVIKSHFDNLLGTILEYAGDTPPQYVVPQLVQPEIYAHLQTMIGMGYKLPGVSEMQAASIKPAGLDSGKAIRTMDDVNIQRFQTIAQGYEQFYVDLTRITVYQARQAFLKNPKLSVKVPGRRFIQTIDWKDVDMDDDQFCLQIFPTSKLPTDPEGRLATIQEMMQSGLIDPQTGRRLLDYPDLDSEENLGNATTDYLHSILDGIVEDGKFTPPEPYDNLGKAETLALEYYAKGKLNNLKESRLELLRRFIKQVGSLKSPPAPMPSDAPISPQANPEPPPTSNLVPNVNGPVAA